MGMRTILTVIQWLAALDLWLDSMGLGMRYPAGHILDTLRHPRALARTVIVSAFVVPALAWGMISILPLSQGLAAGILLAAIGSATPDALRLTERGKGHMPYAVGLMAVLNLLNMATIPAWAFLMFPVVVTIDPTLMLRQLLLSLGLPYVVGVLVRRLAPERTQAWGQVLHRVGGVLIVPVAGVVILVLTPMLWSLLGTYALLAGGVITLAALGLGYLSGGRQGDVHRASAILTASRGYAPAILIATTNAPDNRAILAGVAAMIIMGIIVRLPIALWWNRHFKGLAPGTVGSRRDAA
jgi:BASS family bile acid:Na+ symporter